jgi:hypothetical protein
MSFDDHDASGSLDNILCHEKPCNEQGKDPFNFEYEVIFILTCFKEKLHLAQHAQKMYTVNALIFCHKM